ncbi:hypothetical protein EVAR_23160_1 [Eumeta japonica]|uniref:Uncharacterized protein n=1 Tax=Eumeta variegata TaxID=151549 RepID=A0A4C1VAQ2_EUMVA|nr:hypothetical protein EVAR_23160_1 [Eumeta japonica]
MLLINPTAPPFPTTPLSKQTRRRRIVKKIKAEMGQRGGKEGYEARNVNHQAERGTGTEIGARAVFENGMRSGSGTRSVAARDHAQELVVNEYKISLKADSNVPSARPFHARSARPRRTLKTVESSKRRRAVTPALAVDALEITQLSDSFRRRRSDDGDAFLARDEGFGYFVP